MAFKSQVTSLKLVPSSGGVFEVSVNGQGIYSKKATGQFPDPEAIVKAVRARL